MSPDGQDVKAQSKVKKKSKAADAPVSAVVPKKRKLLEYSEQAEDAVVKEEPAEEATSEPKSPKPKTFREANLERMLFRWYERRQTSISDDPDSGSGPPDVLKKAALLSKRLGASDEFTKSLDKDWVHRWYGKYGVVEEMPSTSAESLKEVKVEVDTDDPLAEVHGGEYTDDQIYSAFAFQLDWTSLPDKTLEVTTEDRVWLLMAGNRSGRHRTRMLITGRQWRPKCLRNVNMLSQPVVYAGGGIGMLTPDLFTWWFHREFAPAALSLNDRGAVLVIEQADFLPSASDCIANDGKVKLVIYRKGENPYSVYPDQSLVAAELRTRYAMLLLHDISLEQQRWLSVSQFLASFSLKDAFPMLHRAWLNIRPETFSRCWAIAAAVEPNVGGSLSFGKSASTPLQVEEDRMLLLELQWLAHDLGLEVTDEDLANWVGTLPEPPADTLAIKPEPVDEEVEDTSSVPTATEAATYLQKTLVWMESQPIEPNLLMVVRDVMTMAKQASKMGLGPTHPGTGLPFFCHNGDHLTQPPPAHMGIPPYQLDPKGAGLTRPPIYPFTAGQYPYPMLSPEMTQVAASWHAPNMYPISTASAGFRSPYPTSLPITSSSLPSDLYRFSPSGLMAPHPGLSPHSHPSLSHPAIVTPGPKQELQSDHNHRSSMDHKNSSSLNDGKSQDSGHTSNNQDKKKPHIKKPLNAFMLYMKEMRAKVVAECTLKESAAINQILGRRWHALGRDEQAKYYELARRERQLHMQLYPDWSSRANANRGKKRKRKQETNEGGNSMKKCRARYGLDQQSQWCKPCRRKKKCIRYMECGDDGNQSEDNLGSCGSVGDAQTPPDDDGESFQHSLSSPGGLSGLSSLTSPSMVLPSPNASLASPSVSLASPCMSLQSPLTPHQLDYECSGKPPAPSCLPLLLNHHLQVVPPHRNPVGTNPHDINNPLSVNQLTGKCIKNSSPSSGSSSATSSSKDSSRPVISVT
ncbi:uncharacterized protein LOC124359738 isoform X2 [Homalodisca vitripennis]|nr:uncharacterized protein LOC124359738 isoform X2 [Homalodisca vitripennis]